MKPRDVIKREALGLAITTVAALYPPLWRRMWQQELRGRRRPIWKKVAVAIAVALAAYWMEEHRRRNLDRWTAEYPEILEGLPRRRDRVSPEGG